MAGEKILVADDEIHIVELIKYNLENNGYKVYIAQDGREALKIINEKDIDLIILDIMMPEVDGLEVCKTLKRKESTQNIPVIMLTAKGEEFDKILGLELGADDYITKPFSVRELMARVKVVLRRVVTDSETNDTLKIGSLLIDVSKHEVLKNGEKLDLTLKEFELLKLLVTNKGKVLTRDSLLDRIWGYEYYGETRTVDVHIRHLRQKIENDDKNPQYIETIRGIGYRFNSPSEPKS
ncbi:alkaline phosphatase synthesis transcriptional regulatory protein PhoP [Oxobacter pfennigii]|uniref:Stage 0 sporulation protein A homolog n=1 Tax=Oxobacter pfennigii TaxID=36849 RepID=A0A0P8W5R0_9CLOT|nr:response regulator transcription factor [Oxobacter pfennigii]KPU44025.1 alkaline phosphatase synthesis transcriptional regulatory protein PhoP [Oxobacter pfennigii]